MFFFQESFKSQEQIFEILGHLRLILRSVMMLKFLPKIQLSYGFLWMMYLKFDITIFLKPYNFRAQTSCVSILQSLWINFPRLLFHEITEKEKALWASPVWHTFT